MLLGAIFALGLSLILGSLGALTGSAAVAALLAAMGYALAGAITVWWKPTIRSVDPAIGTALAVAAYGILQMALIAEKFPEVTPAEMALALVVTTAMAFALAWVGARLVRNALTARPTRRGR